MQTKQALKVLGTILILLGIFGYLFPTWGSVVFTNNENLLHVLTGLLIVILSSVALQQRKQLLFAYALGYLVLALYGFTLKQPDDFLLNNQIVMRLDMIDNVIHSLFGLAFAWTWLHNRTNAS